MTTPTILLSPTANHQRFTQRLTDDRPAAGAQHPADVAAFVAVRLSASVIGDLLFGLTATNVANLVGAIAVMLVVALAACAVPALRAARIDPLAGIRDE